MRAHYRIIDAQANLHCDGEGTSLRAAAFRTLHADDAHCWLQEGRVDAARAVELGIASERLDEAMEERAMQFAQWLACQPHVGVCHMLQLTCPTAEDPALVWAKRRREELLRSALRGEEAVADTEGPTRNDAADGHR